MLDNTRVVVFALSQHVHGKSGTERRADKKINERNNTMKKTIILAIGFALATAVLARAGDAKEIFEAQCAKCHGIDGKGQVKMGQKLGIKDYTDAKVQDAFTDEQAFKALKEGLKDSDDKIKMKPVEGVSDDDIKALVKYVRGFKK